MENIEEKFWLWFLENQNHMYASIDNTNFQKEIFDNLNVLFVFITSILFGQNKWKDSIVYSRYPDGQQAYIGGNIKLYKDIHELMKKRNSIRAKIKRNYILQRLLSIPIKR